MHENFMKKKKMTKHHPLNMDMEKPRLQFSHLQVSK